MNNKGRLKTQFQTAFRHNIGIPLKNYKECPDTGASCFQTASHIISPHHRGRGQHMPLHRKMQVVETETSRQVQLRIQRIHN